MLGRTASSMVSLILVLFALDRYQSAAVAGAATFLSIAPGLLVSPIAGALLDRHGRTRLIFVDYVVAATALVLIAVLDAAGSLPVPLLLLIVTAHSLTFPLSNAGMRTLFPVLRSAHEERFALAETLAHLRYLERRGKVREIDGAPAKWSASK